MSDPRRGGRWRLATAALAALVAGCGRGPLPTARIVELPGPPGASRGPVHGEPAGEGAAALALGGERRFVWAGGTSWRLATGGAPGLLLLGAGGRAAGGLGVEVDLVEGRRPRPLLRAALPGGRWSDRAVAVPAATAGAALSGRLAGCAGPSCGWSDAAFVPGAPRPPAGGGRPNVLVILADTLRADALGAYGAAGNPTPALDTLARAGTRFAQAHAAASWTLPSIAGLFTSLPAYQAGSWAHQPQFLFGENLTLGQTFAAAGYWTAAFSGSAVISYDTGFGKGFDTFWADAIEGSGKPDALEVAHRAADWLRVNQQHPFMAYVHFQDCHSPYVPARDLPSDPRAPLPGDSDGARMGRIPMPGPAELAEWRRLYAEDVAEVDRGVGAVLAALAPAIRRRTLVVFVADHGEEFMDHGYVGHAWSLYEELVHVPLLMAGPSVPAGRVVAEPVSLLDVLPTLAARAGVVVPAPDRRLWQGIDLSPAFAGLPLPPRRPLLSQTESFGPTRLAVAAGPLKAIFFNRFNRGAGAPGGAADTAPIDARVAELLPRLALFDLGADPGERRNLENRPEFRGFLRGARDLALAHLGAITAGRWLAVRGPGSAGTIRGRVRFAATPRRVLPYFLREDEQVTLAGDTVEVRLRDDGTVRGWLIPDQPELRVLGADLTAGGRPLTRAAWQPGAGSLPAAAWAEWPTTRPSPRPVVSGEFLRRLRALGYIQ
ncbi:MAG TPA: sulfatase [Thermoanaerobaculia bacterium]|jgi:arylsulfatase A-like enzyme|nr:sulfatase [Thermoanaerobaculia bacterium]